MTILTGRVLTDDAAGVRAFVTLELGGTAVGRTAQGHLVAPKSVWSDADGTWHLHDVTPSADVDPDGTWYVVSWRVGNRTEQTAVTVPDDVTVDLVDCDVVDDPTPQDSPFAALVRRVDALEPYRHDQPTPSDTWTIVHGRNGYPPVTLKTSDGGRWLFAPEYPDLNTAIVRFPSAVTGVAYAG